MDKKSKPRQSKYFHIHNHTEYSLLDGLSKVTQMVELAAEMEHPAVGLSDHGTLGGAVEFYKACRANDIEPILGEEFYIVNDVDEKAKGEKRYHLNIYARDFEGYKTLVRLSTLATYRDNYWYKPRLDLELIELMTTAEEREHLVVTSSCVAGECAVACLDSDVDLGNTVEKYLKLFPHFFLELMNHETKEEGVIVEKLYRYAYKNSLPFILTNDCHYLSEADAVNQDMLLTIQRDAAFEDPERWRFPGKGYWFKTEEEMRELFSKKVFTAGLKGMQEFLKLFNLQLPALDAFEYSIMQVSEHPDEELKRLAESRLDDLDWEDAVEDPAKYQKQMEYELKVIRDKGFADYFLLVKRYVDWCRGRGILTNTRGSASSSLINYLIGITELDPIKFNLIFERFVNPDRTKLPDIDLDVADIYRDELIEFIKEEFGKDMVGNIGTYGGLTNRSALKFIGKALGVPERKIMAVNRSLYGIADEDLLDRELLGDLDSKHPELYPFVEALYETKRYVGTHAAGFVLGSQERPLKDYIPFTLIPGSGKYVTQFNMDSVEELGYLKIDILGLRNLTTMLRCKELIGLEDFNKIPLDDTKTFEMLRRGETVGVFTFEGKENRRGCLEVQPQNVQECIEIAALYRPANLREGLEREYLKNKADPERVKYAHPILKEILEPTKGIVLYQEQVMQICYKLGFEHGEVEYFLKAMKSRGKGKRAREAQKKLKPLVMERGAENKFKKSELQDIWRYLEGYTLYGFNRAHATSYGVLGYKCAWMKANYPREYMFALLETAGAKPEYVAEAKRLGVKFFPPDVNKSEADFTLNPRGIRFGLAYIKGVGPNAAREIVEHKPYKSVEDFEERTTTRIVNKRVKEALQRVGAYKSLGAKVEGVEKAEAEIELLGVSVSNTKLKPYAAELRKKIETEANERRIKRRNTDCYIGGTVIEAEERKDKKGRAMGFIQLGYTTRVFKVVVWARDWKPDKFPKGAVYLCKATSNPERDSFLYKLGKRLDVEA